MSHCCTGLVGRSGMGIFDSRHGSDATNSGSPQFQPRQDVIFFRWNDKRFSFFVTIPVPFCNQT